MKKTVPFELFGANQYIMFDIMRLAELETAMGSSIVNIAQKTDVGVRFCMMALPIGMRQHYYKATPAMFAEKIGEYLTGGEGRTIDDIATPLVKAIALTGVFGSAFTDQPQEAEEEGKNG